MRSSGRRRLIFVSKRAEMYCITFYSYKGGVGRTLALANVAAHLAMRRKKVLIVDFDLEAPGITTLNFCANAQDKPGVVDFIHDYLDIDAAPSAGNYIHSCVFTCLDSDDDFELDVMPAGDQSASYGAKFAKIDWRELYEERDGFLLMEDLREQWAALGYDYVLIDSRTGLTDVSGICTRQLPDAVVAVFFPNEQNLVGLTELVQSVRESNARPEKPELLFVASRLPRLDDENGVLERWLDRFKHTLGYSKQQFRKLDQYDSLALLDQDVFVLCRPKTSLSKQYRSLGSLITQLNPRDATGAVDYVRTISQPFAVRGVEAKAMGERTNPFSFEREGKRLTAIETSHQKDYVVQRTLAEYYYANRDLAKLEVVLRHGLAAGEETEFEGPIPIDTRARLLQLQMKLHAETGEADAAAQSALVLLGCATATERMVVEALMLLVTTAPQRLPEPSEIAYLRAADVRGFHEVMRKFGISSREALYNSRLALYALERFDGKVDEAIRSTIELALIAGGEFEKALAILADAHDPKNLPSNQVPDAFNRIMALWGREGVPDETLFSDLLDLTLRHEDDFDEMANFQQCIGLIHAVLKQPELCEKRLDAARRILQERSGRREISCWSFVEEPADEFLSHCNSIRLLAQGEPEQPLFLSRDRARHAKTVADNQ